MPLPTDASIFSNMLGISRSSGSDFLTVAAHKTAETIAFSQTHIYLSLLKRTHK